MAWPARTAPLLAAGLGVDAVRMHVALEDAIRSELATMADLTASGAIG